MPSRRRDGLLRREARDATGSAGKAHAQARDATKNRARTNTPDGGGRLLPC
jgi:hypothetical protein